MDNPENREEGILLGLIHKDTPQDLDGFGEYVKKKDAVDPETGKAKETETE